MRAPFKTHTIWQPQAVVTYPELTRDIQVDVTIVGGGIAGLSAAYVLKKNGLRVAVVEKNAVASSTTAGTTGKVTLQHGIFYHDLIDRFGSKNAQVYVDAHQQAFVSIQEIIQKEHIDCDWQPDDNFVYTTDKSRLQSFRQEAEAAAGLGLPATFVTDLALPFKTLGAVRFADQARFNAVAYTRGLAQGVDGDGSYVFENSNVTSIKDGSPARVRTSKGSVQAKHVIIATKIPPGPLLARIGYSTLVYPQTSYVVAGKADFDLQGMYISLDNSHYSLLPTSSGDLLIGGEGHIPGLGLPNKHYRKLTEYGQRHFGLQSANYKWKEMDYIAYDKLPVVGKLYPWSRHVYSITGFKKWGLVTSMVAAQVIHDLIQGAPTPAAKLFYPHRQSAPLSIPRAIREYLS